MFILSKIPYYLFSGLTILSNLRNPFVVLRYLKKPITLEFKNDITFKTLQLLDPLIIKETIFDDAYVFKTLGNTPQYIIDVGAGLGDFCIWAAKQHPHANILAFEPNSDQFKMLLQNIRINNVNNIRAYNVAIGTKDQYVFYVARYNVRSSIFKDSYSTEKVKVKAKRWMNLS